MRRWGKWIGAAVAAGLVMSVAMSLGDDKFWGWDLVIRWLVVSTVYALLGPLMARSWHRAEERDAQHMRDIKEARRGRR